MSGRAVNGAGRGVGGRGVRVGGWGWGVISKTFLISIYSGSWTERRGGGGGAEGEYLTPSQLRRSDDTEAKEMKWAGHCVSVRGVGVPADGAV